MSNQLIKPPLPHLSETPVCFRPTAVNIVMPLANLIGGFFTFYVIDFSFGLSLRDFQAQFNSSQPVAGLVPITFAFSGLFMFYRAGNDAVAWIKWWRENAK